MLTALQQRKLPNLFAVQDTNKDGYLDWSDYEAFHRQLMALRGVSPESSPSQDLLARLRRYWDGLTALADPNGDQRISLKEWLAYQDQLLGTGLRESVSKPIGEMVWQLLDGDGDGAVSAAEYTAIYTWRGLDPQQAAANFQRLDRNGDGRLTVDEITV